MSFARNFALGQQIAQNALDTYDTAREKSRLRSISEAKPTEIENAYTTQDAEQLRALANAKDAQGNPYYNLQANPDGSYGLKTNFEYQGQDGQMVQPGGVAATFAPRSSVVEFMGTRYAPEDLNEDRIAGIRARAMADVVAERDPVRGLQMRQSIKASERDDIRFGWERDQQPLKQKQLEQSVRGGEIDLGQKERQLLVQQAEDAAMKMPEDQVRLALVEYLNTNRSDLPLFVLGKTKDGFIVAERDPQTGVLGEQFHIPLAVGRKLVVGRQLADEGFGKEALQYLSGVDDNIDAIIDRYTKNMLDVARVNNDATYRSGQLRISQQQADQTGAYYRGLIDARNRADRQNAAAVELENQINGVLEGYQAAMAAGPQGREAAAIYAREYDQLRAVASQRGLRVPPTLQSMQAAQKPGAGLKPVKVEEAGQPYLVPGADGSQRLMLSDGRGGYIAENGVLPTDRAAVLAKAGVPQSLIPRVVWADDGASVMYRGREYGLDELKLLARDAARLGANDIAVDEAQKLPHGIVPSHRPWFVPPPMGPKLTYVPDPNAPSIYAGPEAWRQYRESQNR
jgi:hypothetical protein